MGRPGVYSKEVDVCDMMARCSKSNTEHEPPYRTRKWSYYDTIM